MNTMLHDCGPGPPSEADSGFYSRSGSARTVPPGSSMLNDARDTTRNLHESGDSTITAETPVLIALEEFLRTSDICQGHTRGLVENLTPGSTVRDLQASIKYIQSINDVLNKTVVEMKRDRLDVVGELSREVERWGTLNEDLRMEVAWVREKIVYYVGSDWAPPERQRTKRRRERLWRWFRG